MPIMKNDAIGDTIFSTILQIRKKNNRADNESIYKQIIKAIDFEDVTKEFFHDMIHTLINDEKMINKRNRNADSYYVNTELVDTGALTNRAVTNKDSNEIENEIVQLAKSAKTDKSKVAVSSLVPRKDKLNQKAKEVNTFLKEKCEESNFDLISYFNISPHR